MVKSPPAVQETSVPSLGQEDALEKGMASLSSILAWRIPWTEEPGRLYSPWGCKESDMTEATEYEAYLLPFILNYCPLTYPRNSPRTLRPMPVSLGGSVSASFKRAVVRN